MDPSKIQSDGDNDVHSLEGADTVVESKLGDAPRHDNTSATDNVINAATPTGDDKPSGSKPPFFKRLWQKFNIYLLLFVLVVLVAIAITVVLFLKNRTATKQNQATITSQTLSPDALKQLADTSVSIGSSKQVLTVESNAIFSGAILVRGAVEVAGALKVGGDLQLPSITVTGAGRFGDLQANNLVVGNNTTIQGAFTAQKGIAVTGNSTINGALSTNSITTSSLLLNGDLTLTHHITAGGPVPGVSKGAAVGSGGTVSLSGSDSSGSLTINTGSGTGAGCFATITFAAKFSGVPHVSITPIGSGAAGLQYYVNRSTTDFSVCTANPAPTGQTFGFDYVILD